MTLANGSTDRCLHRLIGQRCSDPHCYTTKIHGFSDLRVGGIELSTAWIDHTTARKRDGQLAALVAQPYGLGDDDRAALLRLGAKPGLGVEIDDAGGWYGHGTIWIAIWRDGEISLADVATECSECFPGDWLMRCADKALLCGRCAPDLYGNRVTLIDSDDPFSDSANSEWVSGRLPALRKWAQMATFMYDATSLPATTTTPEEN
ncbi:hypothetical protein AOZ07_11440 [Glutamicibacter halophytocola]|uniref:hypothetical protein n=1 Tax=Glutamicibacter halophytocola TaxID=1933880 RepID=UPI0006D4AB90|nr:hypothetical protein [Glutamicibacter halophytocola]ALG29531.1 hypothetical protein AOZ07_11440 [Glutamicibacter halophytocola]